MANGVIKSIVSEKGFGFIRSTEGRELFFHSSQLPDKVFQELREGQQVEFDIAKGSKGPKAIGIRPLRNEMKKRYEDKDRDSKVPLYYWKDTTRARRRAFHDRDRKYWG